MLSLMMSLDPTVFAAYALNSGEAIKAPAMKAAAIAAPTLMLIMFWMLEKSYKTR
jgi:hypothetical protein